MTLLEKIKNNPFIAILISCAVVISMSVTVTTWFYDREMANIISKCEADKAYMRNNYENKIKELEKKIISNDSSTNITNNQQRIKSELLIKETCSTIKPIIQSPSFDEEVTSPLKLKGTVIKIPNNSFLWVIIYNPRADIYSDSKPIVPGIDMKWQTEVKLIGGMEGDKFEINIILANEEQNSKLSNYISKETKSVPKGLKYCFQVIVKLKL